MRRVLLECFMLVSLFSLSACIPEKNEMPDSEVLSEENVQEEDGGGIALGEDESEKIPEYQMLSMKEAQKIFEKAGDYIILDVREEEEFATGHIPGAICIPHEQIVSKAPEMIPDKEALIYVYCRTGRRSKIAAQALWDAGYRNVVEIGSVYDYTGELETDK